MWSVAVLCGSTLDQKLHSNVLEPKTRCCSLMCVNQWPNDSLMWYPLYPILFTCNFLIHFQNLYSFNLSLNRRQTPPWRWYVNQSDSGARLASIWNPKNWTPKWPIEMTHKNGFVKQLADTLDPNKWAQVGRRAF